VGKHQIHAAAKPRGHFRAGGWIVVHAFTACLGIALAGAAWASETHVVVIENMRFNPPVVTVQRGDRIVWVNKDLVPHTANSDGHGFDSGNIASTASWSYLAKQPGSYPYSCAFHPMMHGTLTVR
jgi:plastocyanin